MNYTYKISNPSEKTERYIFNVNFESFFQLLTLNDQFIAIIINIFKNSNFQNVYWQFPLYSDKTKLNQAYFDLISTSRFNIANPSAFSNQFIGKLHGEIIVFENISGDTDLISIVPTKNHNINSTFSDIMNFMKNGEYSLQLNMLKKIGSEMRYRKHCYLSTHGKGVDWLHIRMCNSPKYYV